MQDAAHHVAGIPSSYGLDQQGLRNLAAQYWNLSVPVLYEHAVRRREGLIGAGGAFVARTGPFTGRTPKDKYIVEEASSQADIWWGDINKPVSEERFESMYRRLCAYYQGREVFVQDMFGGADPDYRLKVRVVSDSAWHSLFARNMFIRPRSEALHAFEPDFTILHAPRFFAMHELDGTNSDTFIFVNFARRLVLIGGTEYAGEIKKCVFGYLNFVLPARDVLP
ncbi:MAG TPA: phosphoenolpyruvate carboxykinase (ATP), partial [Stellaceae bacterium]|nr:phosphoenolpyruvate carboxykinase (ATP) [Stellaceae bacterium]